LIDIRIIKAIGGFVTDQVLGRAAKLGSGIDSLWGQNSRSPNGGID